MADLFTHFAAASLPAARLRDRRIAALLVFGTFLPDLASKGLYWVTRSAPDFTIPTHSILGLGLLSYAAALFVEERLRRPAFAALFAGGLLHVAVDLFKDNLGSGSAYLFYPISLRSYEIPVIDPENVILLVPFDVAVLAFAWFLERKRVPVRQ